MKDLLTFIIRFFSGLAVLVIISRLLLTQWRTLMFQFIKFVQAFKDLYIIYLHSQFAIYLLPEDPMPI